MGVGAEYVQDACEVHSAGWVQGAQCRVSTECKVCILEGACAVCKTCAGCRVKSICKVPAREIWADPV